MNQMLTLKQMLTLNETNVSRAFTLLLLPAIMLLSACASNSPAPNAQANSSAANPAEVQQMLQEWKELKPGITRMLAVEDEMNQLLGQLGRLSNALNESDQQQQIATTNSNNQQSLNQTSISPVASAPVVAAAAAAPAVSASAAAEPAATDANATTSPSQTVAAPAHTSAKFALQLASVTDKHQLPNIWQEMYSKNPQLLADLEPNFQQVYVNNNNYFRLKLGGFDTQQAAAQKCRQLKTAGVFCLVVSYTPSDFAQLANPQSANSQLTANN